jgi:hypothetical protein
MLSFRSCFFPAVVLMCLLVGLTLIDDAASLLQLWLQLKATCSLWHLLLWHIMTCKNSPSAGRHVAVAPAAVDWPCY